MGSNISTLEMLQWPISPLCPAPFHNTCSAARGVRKNAPRHAPCVCDHAVDLLQSYRRNRLEYYKERTRVRRFSPEEIELRRVSHVAARGTGQVSADVRMPDLHDGACQTAYGILTVDRYMTEIKSHHARMDMKALCDECPARVHAACGAWILAAERPAGSWPGMYAGMTPRDRTRRAIAVMRESSAAREASA